MYPFQQQIVRPQINVQYPQHSQPVFLSSKNRSPPMIVKSQAPKGASSQEKIKNSNHINIQTRSDRSFLFQQKSPIREDIDQKLKSQGKKYINLSKSVNYFPTRSFHILRYPTVPCNFNLIYNFIYRYPQDVEYKLGMYASLIAKLRSEERKNQILKDKLKQYVDITESSPQKQSFEIPTHLQSPKEKDFEQYKMEIDTEIKHLLTIIEQLKQDKKNLQDQQKNQKLSDNLTQNEQQYDQIDHQDLIQQNNAAQIEHLLQNLKELQQTITELDKTKKQNEQEIQKLKDENLKLKYGQGISEISSSNQQFEKKIMSQKKQLEQQISEQSAQIEKLQKELKCKNQQGNVILFLLISLTSQDQQQDQIHNLQQQIIQMQQQHSDQIEKQQQIFQNQIEQLKKENEQQGSGQEPQDNNEKDKIIDQLRQELNEIKINQQNALKEYQEFEQKNKQLTEQNQLSERSSRENQQEWEEKVNKLEQQLKQKSEQSNQLLQDNEEYVNYFFLNNNLQVKKMTELEEKLEANFKQIQQLEDELHQHNQQISNLNSEILKKDQEIAHIQSELFKEVEKSVQNKQDGNQLNEVSELKVKLNELQLEKDTHLQEVLNYKQENQNLQEEIFQMTKLNKQLETSIDDIRENYKHIYTSEIQDLKQEVQQKQEKLDSQNGVIFKQELQIKDLEFQLKSSKILSQDNLDTSQISGRKSNLQKSGFMEKSSVVEKEKSMTKSISQRSKGDTKQLYQKLRRQSQNTAALLSSKFDFGSVQNSVINEQVIEDTHKAIEKEVNNQQQQEQND